MRQWRWSFNGRPGLKLGLMRDAVRAMLASTVVLVASFAPGDARATEVVGNWIPNGLFVSSGPGVLISAQLVFDGSGGVYVSALRRTSSLPTYEIRLQHVLNGGQLDPLWPTDGILASSTLGVMGAQPDRAGGLYLVFNDLGGARVIRFRRDGSRFAGWPVAGVSLSKEPGAAWAPDGVSGVWSFTLTSHQACSSSEPLPCRFWTTVAATRVDGNGNVVPGWEAPGREIMSVDFTSNGSIAAQGFLGGIALLLMLHDSRTFDRSVLFAHVNPDGGVLRAYVDRPQSFPTTFYDIDDTGTAIISLGSYTYSNLEKHSPGPAWPYPGWTFPLPAYNTYAVGATRDGHGGGYLRTAVGQGLDVIPQLKLNHVMSDGTADPGWPLLGVSVAGAGAQFQSQASMTSDGRGGCFLTWEDSRSGTDPDIYGLRVAPNGSIIPGWDPAGSPISLLARSRQVLPRLALDPLANVFVLWLDERSGKLESYVQKFGADLPVPVQVQHATARLANQGVELAWDLRDVATANLKVERVVDVEGWSELGQPEAAAAPDHWVFVDRRPVRGAHATYRLRNSTSGWYGGEVEIDVPAVGALSLRGLVPNPLTPSSRIDVNAASRADIDLFVTDLLGRLVAQKRLAAVEVGPQRLEWRFLSELPVGLYWLRVRQGDQESGAKFVVTR